MNDDLTTEILDKAYKAGDAFARREMARKVDAALGRGFMLGVVTGFVGAVFFVEYIAFMVP